MLSILENFVVEKIELLLFNRKSMDEQKILLNIISVSSYHYNVHIFIIILS